MTNNWPDIGNATLVVAMGANPAENHPACMAHINNARKGAHTWYDGAGNAVVTNKPVAKLLVIDPRYTRTASQADNYVRIRPGTDIAFINGLIKYITDNISGQQKTNFLAYLNQKQGQAYLSDGNASTTVADCTRYTDARILVNSTRTDYQRARVGTWALQADTLAGVTRPSIILDGATLKMWFVPSGASTYIQYSTSVDNGLNWTAFVDTDVLKTADSPRVFKEGATYYMTNTDNTDITISSSADGLAWGAASVLATHDLFESGALTKIDAPMVLKDATSWKLYVQGTQTVDSKRRVYLASTATMDPSTWTPSSFTAASATAIVDVGTAGSFDEDYAMHPFVWKDGTRYYMTYTARNAGSSVFTLGSARSDNGLVWIKTGQLTEFPNDSTKANIVYVGDTGYQFFTLDGSSVLRRASNGAQISNFPVFASSCTAADTVYSLLLQHVAPYTLGTVADICGCSTADIELVAKAFMDNSQCSSYDPTAATTTIWEPKNQYYRATTMLYAMGITQHTHGAQNVKSFAVLQTLMGNMGRCGGGINALRGIHNVQGSTDMGLLYGNTVGYNFSQPTDVTNVDANGFGKYLDKLFGNRLSGGTLAYDNAYTRTKMGLQQRGWYNQLLAWFGPGVSGRTNVNKVWDLYPKGNGDNHIQMFRNMASGSLKAAVVWGMNPAVTEPNQSKVRAGLANLELLVVTDNYATETAQCHRKDNSRTYLLPACSYVEEAGSVANSGRVLQWRERAALPKGNSKADIELLLRFAKVLNDHGGFSHIATQWAGMTGTGAHLVGKDVYDVLYKDRYGWSPADGAFESASLTGVDIWRGENPAPTLPFSGNTVTGSEAVTERIYREMSGPQNTGGTVWLYLEGYDDGYRAAEWSPTSTANFNYVVSPTTATPPVTTVTVPGSVVVTNISGTKTYIAGTDYTVVQESTTTQNGIVAAINGGGLLTDGGTFFVRYQAVATWQNGRGRDWQIYNRAKSRNNADRDPSTVSETGTTKLHGHRMYKNWGYSWLVNRRVLYSSSADLPWDQTDAFQGPERCSRMFTSTNTGTVDYATSYRHIHQLKDKPDVVLAGGSGSTGVHYIAAGISLAGRFPSHTEPYETPDTGLAATWGRNTAGGSKWDLVLAGTAVYAPDDTNTDRTGTVPAEITTAATAKSLPDIAAPLVLTTIRCVEHFQGGPITRNNSYNVEAEPVPWIEINSIDARARGIDDGDWVNVVTVRSNSTTDQTSAARMGTTSRWVAQPGNPADNFGKGWRARVGVGLSTNQRVGAGVVAIPWHWGDQGLSTGARANDLCIDAMDANTTIPEYKACICWITKA